MKKSAKKIYINGPIIIIGALFFVFGFITWLNSVLIPYLKIACQLTNLEAYLVAFSFYISYLTMAIPSGKLLKFVGYKKGMAIGLMIMACGACLFIPAAITRTYLLFLLGLFIQGTGLALLQTASNPYITILGPLESAAKRISIMGICNKAAGAIAPIILGTIVLKDTDILKKRLLTMDSFQKNQTLNELATRVIAPYIFIVCLLAILGLIIFLSSLPEINTDQEDETLAVKNNGKKSVLQFPQLVFGVIAMFFYVGVEVIAGDTIINYGASQRIALSTAKFFTSFTLLSMIAGYLVGILTIPKYLSQNNALKISAIAGVIFSISAITFTGYMSVFFVALLGFANALIFPAIWPQAIAGLGRFTKLGSSLLIMAIAGGAIIPLLYGWLSDKINSHMAYLILVPCYLFIWYYGKLNDKSKVDTSWRKRLQKRAGLYGV